MIVLAGGDLVLPDRVVSRGSLVIDGDRIAAVEPRAIAPAGADVRELAGQLVVPGFIDVHVHGVLGVDTLDGPAAVSAIAALLPRFGVTAFCPTSVACTPDRLTMLLDAVAAARRAPARHASAVLPAHLESNFINPDWSGAQPLDCLRTPVGPGARSATGGFSADDVLTVLRERAGEVAIVTIAPELPGGFDLIRALRDLGGIVSIGHSGATFDEARAAIRAGVTHATHLFNRMTPLAHRAPGVTGAVLESAAVTAEIICDGYHVHPAVVGFAVTAKTVERTMAITDGSAAAALPVGSEARLGGRRIVAGPDFATLDDGTLAGSVSTMDRAFRMLVRDVGLSLAQAAALCATTPARHLSLLDRGRLAPGLRADFVVLDSELQVVETWVGGTRVPEP